MQEIKYIVIGSIIILSVEGLLFYRPETKTKVLSEKVTVTATPAATSTPTPTPSPSPAQTPLALPKPTAKEGTPIPQPVFTSQQINEFIDRFASQYNVSPDILRHIALCESGFNPLAQNYGYAGLFQFGPVTWQNIRRAMGEDPDINLRFNAEEAVQTAAYNLHINNAGIWPHCVP